MSVGMAGRMSLFSVSVGKAGQMSPFCVCGMAGRMSPFCVCGHGSWNGLGYVWH